jgi:hypothetical protein
MKTCSNVNCTNTIPATIIVDGKRRNLKSRKYCFECSEFGKHNTEKLEKQDESCICSICNKKFIYNRKSGHTKEVCNSCMVTKSRQQKKKKAVEYKGGSCQICGYNKSMRALEFHHLDPSKKDFGISESNIQRSWELQKIELDKCILLCCRCHAEVHDGMLTLKGSD